MQSILDELDEDPVERPEGESPDERREIREVELDKAWDEKRERNFDQHEKIGDCG